MHSKALHFYSLHPHTFYFFFFTVKPRYNGLIWARGCPLEPKVYYIIKFSECVKNCQISSPIFTYVDTSV